MIVYIIFNTIKAYFMSQFAVKRLEVMRSHL